MEEHRSCTRPECRNERMGSDVHALECRLHHTATHLQRREFIRKRRSFFLCRHGYSDCIHEAVPLKFVMTPVVAAPLTDHAHHCEGGLSDLGSI